MVGSLARRRLDRVFRRSLQKAVGRRREGLGPGLERRVGVDPEQEADVTATVPAVEIRGLAEVGVAAEVDPPEAGPPAQGDRLVDVSVGLLVRGTAAAAIDQVEQLAGVGQRDHQGVIAPGAVVGDVDAFLALGIGPDEGAIDIDDRLAEEVGGLLGPDPQPGRVDGFHQGDDVGLPEPTAEITRGGGVGDALGLEGIEEDGVVAEQLDVLETATAGEDVEGDVQDVVGFVIGEMAFEEMEVGVDGGDQAGGARQQHHGADAACGEAVDALTEFVVDVAGGDHGDFAFGCGLIPDAEQDLPPALSQELSVAFSGLPALASGDFLRDNHHHSKPSVAWKNEDLLNSYIFPRTPEVFESF